MGTRNPDRPAEKIFTKLTSRLRNAVFMPEKTHVAEIVTFAASYNSGRSFLGQFSIHFLHRRKFPT